MSGCLFEVQCQAIGGAVTHIVADGYCTPPKPVSVQVCVPTAACITYRWIPGPYVINFLCFGFLLGFTV